MYQHQAELISWTFCMFRKTLSKEWKGLSKVHHCSSESTVIQKCEKIYTLINYLYDMNSNVVFRTSDWRQLSDVKPTLALARQIDV